ncbi:MAG: glycosyltransferase [Gammaproteobacteria bacterium]|nr:glycosyltransferase [Gammaproteobacteria bacterium]
MQTSQKLLIIWPGYRKYNREFFLRLATQGNFDLKVIWIRHHRDDDQPDHEFLKQVNSTVIGARNIRLNGYTFSTFAKLCYCIISNSFHSDAVLTSTQAPLHSKVAFLTSLLLAKKLLLVIEQWQKLSKKSVIYRIYEAFGYLMMRRCNTLFVHGDNQREFAIANGVNPHNIRILPFLSDDLAKIKINNPNLIDDLSLRNKVVILYFGRITRRKGLKDLLTAFQRIESDIPQAVLLVCGGADEYFQGFEDDQAYEQECLQLCNALGYRVIITGSISPDIKQDYIALADIFVHPHSTEGDLYEGWGLILNEVSSLSIPIITTDRVGAAKNLVKNNVNGFVVKAGDIEALSERIKTLAMDTNLRQRFAQQSRLLFESYHIPQNIINQIDNAVNNGE